MAGTDSRFSATRFRNAIHFAMTMGKPTSLSEQATFRWNAKTDWKPEDSARRPFVWTATPTVNVTTPDVVLPCAVDFKFIRGQQQGDDIGQFENPMLVVTMLDVDYARIFNAQGDRADTIVIKGDSYDISFVAPPLGLFDVSIYQIYCQAQDVH